MKTRWARAWAVVGIAVGLCVGAYIASQGLPESLLAEPAYAQGAKDAAPSFSPVKALADRDVYYPGSEDLAPDEMRIVACGTGMPNARPKQAAACWLVELGNGDKFIFDIGSGSAERLSAMKIPYDYLDKVFIGHLHSDHFGDLGDLWIGGVIGNRQRPLQVWGPSGAKPEYGTKYACEHMQKMFAWDDASRKGNVNTKGTRLVVTEFDYKGVNQVVYEKNGVTIRTIPAIHAIDGPVSFILEWDGLKFAFSSDTFPNKWWLEHTKGCDIVIHECFAPPSVLIDKQGWPASDALNVGTQVHTSPAQFGKVMSEITPRLAIGYHFFNDFDVAPAVTEMVRKTYDGPFALAVDYMVFNVTKDDIRIRMAVIDEDIWPQPSVTEKLPADPSQKIGFSEFITGGRVPYSDIVDKIYDDINKRYGSDVKAPD